MGYPENNDQGYSQPPVHDHQHTHTYTKTHTHPHDAGYGGHHHDEHTTTGVNAGVAYFIWIIVFLILLWLLRAIGIKWFSTVVFSLIVATFILSLFYPLNIVDGKYVYKSEDALFALIHLITWVLVIIYVIWKVFSDREDNYEQANFFWWNGNGYNCPYPQGNMMAQPGMPGAMSAGAPATVMPQPGAGTVATGAASPF